MFNKLILEFKFRRLHKYRLKLLNVALKTIRLCVQRIDCIGKPISQLEANMLQDVINDYDEQISRFYNYFIKPAKDDLNEYQSFVKSETDTLKEIDNKKGKD